MRVGNKLVPFLSLIIFFVLGIIFCEFVPFVLSINFIITGAAIGLALSSVFLYKFYYKFKVISKVLVSLTLFFVGCLSYVFHSNSSYKDYYTIRDRDKSVVLLLKAEAGSSDKFKKYYTELIHVNNEDTGRFARAGVLLYIPVKQSEAFNYGDKVLVNASITELPKKINPKEFDYKRFLSRKGIDYQVIAKEKELVILEKGTSLLSKVDVFRKKMVQKFAKVMPKKEAALAKALILGYKDDLSVETTSIFQNTGSMHVLAVSGLHLGILFLLLNALLRLPYLVKMPKVFSFLLVVGLLWFYAVLSGLSISVIRASIMFSVLQFGVLIGKKGNVYNSLLVSAWIILLLFPRELFQVGFQLSYLAVLGIVILHPHINGWVESRWHLVNKLWEVVAVAVSAQLAVGVLSMYYFHSFPLLFPVSNVVVMVVTGLQLSLGFLIVLMSWFDPIVAFLGFLLSWLFTAELFCLRLLANLPISSITNIYLTWYEMLLIYLIVIGGIWVFAHQKKGLFLMAFSSLVLGVVLTIAEWKVRGQDEIVLFGTNDICLVHISGKEAYVYKGEHLNAKSFDFFAIPYLRTKGVTRIIDLESIQNKSYHTNSSESLVCFDGNCFGVYSKDIGLYESEIPVVVPRYSYLKLKDMGVEIPNNYISGSRFKKLR